MAKMNYSVLLRQIICFLPPLHLVMLFPLPKMTFPLSWPVFKVYLGCYLFHTYLTPHLACLSSPLLSDGNILPLVLTEEYLCFFHLSYESLWHSPLPTLCCSYLECTTHQLWAPEGSNPSVFISLPSTVTRTLSGFVGLFALTNCIMLRFAWPCASLGERAAHWENYLRKELKCKDVTNCNT